MFLREKNNSAMGKKGGGNKKGTSVTPIHQRINTMREEKCGRKQIKGGSSNIKATLKLQHLQNLAVWASEEAAVPSLGAFFGQRLAASQEAIGVSPDSSLFSCQRFASICLSQCSMILFVLFGSYTKIFLIRLMQIYYCNLLLSSLVSLTSCSFKFI